MLLGFFLPGLTVQAHAFARHLHLLCMLHTGKVHKVMVGVRYGTTRDALMRSSTENEAAILVPCS